MGEKTTKEKIFDVSLELFSQKGFNNTSVREIAREVGIKESSIYNHYSSKQAIMNDILGTFSTYFDNTGDVGNPGMEALLESNPTMFYQMGSRIFREQLRNEKIMKIFRFLFIQMYQDEKVAEFFHKYILEEPLEFWTSIFVKFIEMEIIKEDCDPVMLAREYYAYPIFLLMEIFIENNSFPDDELDKLFNEAEKHVEFIFDAVRV